MRQRAFRSASYARRDAGRGAARRRPWRSSASRRSGRRRCPEPRRERAQRLIEGFGFDRQRMVAIGPPVTVRDRPSRHQVPGGRIMRAKNALISGEASWPSEIVQRHQDGKHRSGRPLRLPIRGSEHQEQRAVRHDAIMAIARPWAQRAVKSIPISLTRMLGSALALAPRTWMQQFGARPTEDAGVTKRPRL
jgi:hypothetical protein